MSFIFMVFHYPTPEHRDELARQMDEMGAFLSATPGCMEVGPPYLTEDGCLIGISTWGSKDAFLSAGLTLGGSDEIVEGETRPRERFFLHEAKRSPVARVSAPAD